MKLDPRNPKHYKEANSIVDYKKIFFILSFVTCLFTFVYIFPFNKLVDPNFRISKRDISLFFNNDFMNYYLSMIYLFIFWKFICFNFNFFAEEVFDCAKNSLEISFLNKLMLFLKFVYSLTTKLLFTIFFLLYISNATSVFYQSINFKVENSYINHSFSISRKFFNNYHINSGYGLFRVMTGVGGRPELEIKYMNRKKKWNNIKFKYKISHKLNRWPIFNIPHQPRIDWQIWFSSLRTEINSETWLVILTGKIFEKNPLILDLLGYHVEGKSEFYKYSYIQNIVDFILGHKREIFIDAVDMIKIEKYNYQFTNYDTMKRTGDIWKKIHQNDFLPPTDVKIFRTFFETLQIPFDKRIVNFSFFQQIPIMDIVVGFLGLWILFRKIFNS